MSTSHATEPLERRVLLAALDPTWNGSGVLTLPDAGRCVSVVPLPSGKVLALVNASSSDRLVRYNANGSLDTGFGIGGGVELGTDRGTQMVVRADGEIFLSMLRNVSEAFLQARGPDGGIDRSFGSTIHSSVCACPGDRVPAACSRLP